MRIGIDLMGSDCSPFILFAAIEQIAEEFPGVNLIVFVTQVALDEIFLRPLVLHSRRGVRIEFQIVTEVIEMNEEPLHSFRTKKDSSLVLGLKLLKKNFLDAFVSAGNTGALIAASALTLSHLPGIKRPALLASLPTEKGNVVVVDVGGNVSCKASHLVQFAQLGAAYQRCYQGIQRPRVGLLNIGSESKKGTAEIRQAYQILQEQDSQASMRFIGNIEGRDVFQGKADVLVTDGFTGNILLKTSEGVSSFILQKVERALEGVSSEQRNEITKSLNSHFNFEEYSGAIICGVDRVVVKCHGQSTPRGLFNGIKGAIKLVQNRFIEQLLKA